MPEKPEETKTYIPPSRARTRSLTVHVGEDVHAAVKAYADANNLKMQDVFCIAYAHFFASRKIAVPETLKLRLKHRRLESFLSLPLGD